MAVRGWDRRNFYYFQMLSSLAAHYGFAVDVPFESLSKKHQQIILHGSNGEDIDFKFMKDRGDYTMRRHAFEGILPNNGYAEGVVN